MGQALPIRIKLISVASALAGLALFGYLGVGEEWGMSVLAGVAFFMVLIIVTISFPLPVAPKGRNRRQYCGALYRRPCVGARCGGCHRGCG